MDLRTFATPTMICSGGASRFGAREGRTLRPGSAEQGNAMNRYVTREDMEAEAPGVYALLPAQIRDRLPADAWASPMNARIFRATFGAMPRLVDDLFARLDYTDRAQWPMWKLVAAFHLIEIRIGQSTVRQAGEMIYSTMLWPSQLRSVADALRHINTAYFESHLQAPPSLVGCWRVEEDSPSRIVVADDTPYPCHVNEGVVAGICRAFSRQRPVYRILDPKWAKRAGGTVTRYQVDFLPL